MKIKKLPLLLCILAMFLMASIGVSAAPIEHDISDGIQSPLVLTDACGSECPGHIITGDAGMAYNNIRILSGSHNITFKNVTCALPYPSVGSPIDPLEDAVLYIAAEAGPIRITAEGKTSLGGYHGVFSQADDVTIHGDENADFSASGLQMGLFAKNITIDGIQSYFGTTGSNAYDLTERNGAVVLGTFTLKNASLQAYSGDVAADGITTAITASKLILENSSVFTNAGQAAYTDDKTGTSCGILVTQSFEATDSTINTTAGEGYDSFGMFVSQNFTLTDSELTTTAGNGKETSAGIALTPGTRAKVTNSSITATGGDGKNSYGFSAYDEYTDTTTLDFYDSDITATAGSGSSISIGIDVNSIYFSGCTVEGNGGNSNYESYGIAADQLIALNSDVTGNGGTTNCLDDDNDGFDYSDGIMATTILGTDSEIAGKGGKALCSDGITACAISLTGGLIQGYGNADSKTSYGITLDLSENDSCSFELLGADVFAEGATQGLISFDENFPGIYYNADLNTETEIFTDFNKKRISFGNPYKVTFDANGVEAQMPEAKTYYCNEEFTLPMDITAEGYEFLGWGLDPAETYPFFGADEDVIIAMGNEDITYYAIWGCKGGKTCPLNQFTDLNSTDWYHDGICFCLKNKIMNGTSQTTFEPQGNTSRAMIVTTLYRMEGAPKVSAENTFTDVPQNTWYTDAVIWGVQNGIVTGYEDNTFRPNNAASREEMATFLSRYFKYIGGNLTAEDIPATYTDKAEISPWAAEAMAWAVDNSIITGITETTLAPKEITTRAQLATILQRFIENSILGEA